VAIDLASLVLAGWRAIALIDRAALPLVVAEVIVLAGVLVLAVAQGSTGRAIEVHVALAEDQLRHQKEAVEERLERSRRDLLEAQARAEVFVQLVVHDLRNPLAVVLTNVQLAKEELQASPAHAEQVELLRIASSEGVRLSRMIGDLLLVPRLEGGEHSGRFAATGVRDVLVDVATAIAARARMKGVRIEVQAPRELVAWIDESLVRRMIENLVANGLRHTPPGGRVELSAQVERDRLRLAVRNTGEPIAGSVRARLFQKYATLGKGDYAARNGLGLYLCRLVAEAHGGTIALVEREGWRVSFEAELPLTPERWGSLGRSAGSGADARGSSTSGQEEARSMKRGERSGSGEEENEHV
jgi:signal transduction histidine kinase